MFEIDDIFSIIALILFIASILGMLAIKLKQPLIVSFIAVGIILGPSSLGWVTVNDQLDLLAKLGISLLLFIVGLKLDLHIIRTMGAVALATGIGQVLFTSLFGYLIALLLNFDQLEAIYIAVALTFSSTIIIVKLLSDKREVDSLHGRIAIGFLIVQDLLVIVAMIVLNALSGAKVPGTIGPNVLSILFNGFIFVVIVGLLMRYLLTRLLNMLAQSKELLLLFSIAWAVSLGALGHYMGFSKEVGAFVAGVSLASTPYRDVLGARLVGLRDFLLLFFFVDLGATLDLSAVAGQFSEALLFSLFVLVGNPLIVMIIMGVMGYRKRTGFLAGLTVAQISEFSLILGALGVSLGHINADILGVITLVGLITISASTYMILYSQGLYQKLLPLLGIFEKKRPNREMLSSQQGTNESFDIIVFGLGRFGRTLVNVFMFKGYSVLAVDFDPEAVRRAKLTGMEARYGDAEDEEFIAMLPLQNTKWVIGAMHDKYISQTLSQHLHEIGYSGKSAFTVHDKYNVEKITRHGAVLIMVHEYAAQHAAQQLIKLDAM
ncbi:cation:proton antiporter [Psychromonas sp.]|uniref:cation:proton antiporter n=1 Tax=Psychromonas sp. TaxID=1884585 RepID=UPI0035692DB7